MSEAPTAFLVAADVVALAPRNGGLSVLLVERGHDPYRGRLALPGGFVEPGEVAESAARRELAEETGIADFPGGFEQLGAYGPAGRRDPRGEVLSVAFLARAAEVLPLRAGDDAAAAHWVPIEEALEPGRLAFDHERILADALQRAARA
ncbi:MAG: NUDIX domain-containing protein [Leucobacter sp.]